MSAFRPVHAQFLRAAILILIRIFLLVCLCKRCGYLAMEAFSIEAGYRFQNVLSQAGKFAVFSRRLNVTDTAQ